MRVLYLIHGELGPFTDDVAANLYGSGFEPRHHHCVNPHMTWLVNMRVYLA